MLFLFLLVALALWCNQFILRKGDGCLDVCSDGGLWSVAVWYWRASLGECCSSQQELWPYPFNTPVVIISTVAACLWLQWKKDTIYMRHMSVVTTAASIMLHPSSHFLFPLQPPKYLLLYYYYCKENRGEAQFSIWLGLSEFVCEGRVML